MLTSKQRAALRGIAQNVAPSINVGKGGINDNMLAEIAVALDCRELVKISVLRSCDQTAKNIADGLAAAVNAEVVQVIGAKIVLYRFSEKDGVKHIEL